MIVAGDSGGQQEPNVGSDLICEAILCGPLPISAFSALKGGFNAEAAEIRRERRENLIRAPPECARLAPLFYEDC